MKKKSYPIVFFALISLNLVLLPSISPDWGVQEEIINDDNMNGSENRINNAGAAYWRNLNAYGGFLLDLAICNSSPNVLWVACDSHGGVFKTVDGGDNWECMGLEYLSILCVSIDPVDPNKVFAGTKDGLYRTLDGGDNWEVVAYAGSGIMAVAVNPYNNSIVYIGAFNPEVLDGTGFGVNRSINGGEPGSFQASGAIAPNLATNFAFNSSNKENIYVSTGSGVFKSYNSGESWTLINTPDWRPMKTVACAGGGVVYGGSLNSSGPGAVYKTDDDGTTWNLKIDFNGTVWDIIVDHNNSEHLYAAVKDNEVGTLGIWESIDGSENWVRKVNGLTDRMTAAIVMDPSNNDTLYTATNGQGGVFKSIDGGDNWAQAVDGMTQMIFKALEPVNITGEEYLYAAAGLGIDRLSPLVWRYSLSNQSWVNKSVLPINPEYNHIQMFSAWDMVSSKNDSQRIYVCGMAHQQGETEQVGMFWRSLDGGATWETPVYSIYDKIIYSVAVGTNSTGGENIYIGLGGANTTNYGIRKSTNGGQTFVNTSGWTGAEGAMILDIAISPQNESIIYAASQYGLLKSINYGDNWTYSGPLPDNSLLYTLWVDPENASHLIGGAGGWVVDNKSIWESLDGGVSWTFLGLNESISSIVVYKDDIFIGTCGPIMETEGNDVWKASFSDHTWERYAEENLTTPIILDILHGSEFGNNETLFLSNETLFVSTLCDGISIYIPATLDLEPGEEPEEEPPVGPGISGFPIIIVIPVLLFGLIYYIREIRKMKK